MGNDQSKKTFTIVSSNSKFDNFLKQNKDLTEVDIKKLVGKGIKKASKRKNGKLRTKIKIVSAKVGNSKSKKKR